MIDVDVSPGCLIAWEGQSLLWSVQRMARWTEHGGVWSAYFTALGGRLEPGETPREALQREAREEAGIEIEICDPTRAPLCLTGLGAQWLAREMRAGGGALPVAIGEIRSSEPGRAHACLMPIYLARMLGPRREPRPAGDIPALVALSVEQLRAHRAGVTVETLRRSGGRVVERADEPLPAGLWLRPFAEPRLLVDNPSLQAIVSHDLRSVALGEARHGERSQTASGGPGRPGPPPRSG